jgi:hypothetical protein
MVMHKVFRGFLLAELLQWIGPKNIAHQSVGRWFPESVDLKYVSSGRDLARKCIHS